MTTTTTTTEAPRLYTRYMDEIRPKLMEEHGIGNKLAAPRLTKIVVSMGVSAAIENKGVLDAAAADLGLITGQKASITKARMSVSNFRLREGMPIGCRVSLRGARMWEFLDRLISVVLPRIKDFRGLSRSSFDQGGNYSFGLTEQAVWPEINVANITFSHGMHINIVFERSNPELSKFVLTELGMPFVRREAVTA